MNFTKYLLVLGFFLSIWTGQRVQAKDIADRLSSKTSIGFIENKGQWDKEVLFQCRLGGVDVWITKTGVNYTFYKVKRQDVESDTLLMSKHERIMKSMKDSVLIHRVIMDYVGSNGNPRGEGKKKQKAYYNYFIGNDSTKHASFVGLYEEVVVHDVYPNIDIRYYLEKGKLRYDYIIQPGADPGQIRFQYRGQDGEEVRNNQLHLNTRFGDVAVRDLYCYQENKAVAGEFVQQGNAWKIKVGEYDRTKPLILDPLIFSTFIGGGNNDIGNDIDVDDQGNSYIVGTTLSINYQVTVGAYDTTLGGNDDIFVSKLNATGTNLVFSTYVGGNSTDRGTALKVDTAGCIYFTGYNFVGNYPVTPGAYQLINSSVYMKGQVISLSEVIITKLNATGSSLLYSTYLGGIGDDYGYDIDIDNLGCAYVCGWASSLGSPYFDVTPGAYYYNGILDSDEVGFATKINQTGTSLVYSCLLGGDLSYNAAIKVSTQGEVFVVGSNDPYNFPITIGAYTYNNTTGYGLFVQRLNAAGSNIIYSLCLKTNDYNYPCDLEIDNDNNAIIAGNSQASNFPVSQGAFQVFQAAWYYKAFIMKFNNSGSLIFSSTIDGFSIRDIDLDNQGNILAVGFTGVNNLPTTPSAYQNNKDSSNDLYLMKLNPNGTTLIHGTYLGGSGVDNGEGICMDSQGNAFITGSTSSTNYDITPNAFDSTHNGLYDAFVTKLDICVPMSVSPASSSPILCINDSFPPIYHTTVGAYLLGPPVNLPPGLSATLSNDSIIISGVPTQGGIYNYQIPLLGSCGNIVATGTISISPYAQLNSAPSTSNQHICVNNPINSITYTLGGGASGAIFNNLPPGVNGNVANGLITINGTPNQLGNYPYQITLTGGCDTTSIYGTIFVDNPTSFMLISLPGTDSQEACINSPIDTIQYIVSGATGAILSGFPTHVVGSFNNGVLKIYGKPIITGFFNYNIMLTGGCDTVNINGFIHVHPNNILTSTSAVAYQSLCLNDSIIPITYTSTSSIGAVFNGLPPGVVGTFNNGSIVISGAPLNIGVFSYSIILTSICGYNISLYGAIQSNPFSTIILSSVVGTDSQQVCVNSPITNIEYTSTGVGGAIFNGLPNGVVGSYNNGNITISGTPLITGTFNYSVLLIGGWCSNSINGTIQVNPNNTIVLSSAVGTDNQQGCVNTLITNIEYTTSGATGATFNGLPNGVLGSYINGYIVINGIPVSVGVFNYNVNLLGGGCNMNQSGILDIQVCNGIQEHSENDFMVYPNPNHNRFTIVSKQGGYVVLSDVSGRIIQQYNLRSSQETVTTALASGIYFLKEVQTGKVIRLMID
jgi:hypothetical protein